MGNLFRWLNKKRRDVLREIQLSLCMKRKRDGCTTNPKLVDSVLFISPALGIGDSLYIIGMASLLKRRGVVSSIACLKQHCRRYRNSGFFRDVYDIEKNPPSDIKVSVVVDLEYRDAKNWRIRFNFMKDIQSYIFTTAPLCRNLSFYDDYIDYSRFGHYSRRLGEVCRKILKSEEEFTVFPLLVLDESSEKEAEREINELIPSEEDLKFVYLNSRAGDFDRWFSKEQTIAILEKILSQDGIHVFLQAPENESEYLISNRVSFLPKMSFEAFGAFLKKCCWVVTPDTSVTHVAACFDIPCLTFFPPNDRDFFKNYGAWEAWGTLSTISNTVHPDSDILMVDKYGFANVKPMSMKDIPVGLLCEKVFEFMKVVNKGL